LISQGAALTTKKFATMPALKPASLRTIVIVWLGRYHIPCAK
jgi:hypothetical protein